MKIHVSPDQEKRVFLPDHPLLETESRLDALCLLGENWNGYNVAAPNPGSIERAKRWIVTLYNDIHSAGHPWLTPHVTANEEGIVVFEWIKGRKRLSVFIDEPEIWRIKAWGADILTEMTDGQLTTAQDRLSVWAWMMEQSPHA